MSEFGNPTDLAISRDYPRLKFRSALIDNIEQMTAWSRSQGRQVLGNISYFAEKVERFHQIVKDLQPKTYLEVGLNAGHSVALVVDAAPDCHVVALDIGDRDYILDASRIVAHHHEKFAYLQGDSIQTLPLLEKTPLDLAFIDGGHTYLCVKNDIKNLAPRINTPGATLILDDTEDFLVKTAMNDAIEDGTLSKLQLVEVISAQRYTQDKISTMHVFRCS